MQRGHLIQRTHVIQAPEVEPKAICHAGSKDWKYSSGWKKVCTERAFTHRKRRRKSHIVVGEYEAGWAEAGEEGVTDLGARGGNIEEEEEEEEEKEDDDMGR